MSDPHWQSQIDQPYIIIIMELQIMGVLSVDGRPWERVGGRSNEGAGGGHACRCY
jgi:hypothetical protein